MSVLRALKAPHAARQLETTTHLPKKTRAKKIRKRATTTPRESTGLTQQRGAHGIGTAYKGHAVNALKGSRAGRKVTQRAVLADSTGSNRPAPVPRIKGVPPAMNASFGGDGRLERPAPKRKRRVPGSGFAGSGGGDY